VGWKLAEEVAAARPDKPGPEWWTLMDIAIDARDDSRRAMPGHEFLMERAKCSYPTLKRRVKALTDAGRLKVVRRSAPGTRAVYEIPPLVALPATWLTNAEPRLSAVEPP